MFFFLFECCNIDAALTLRFDPQEGRIRPSAELMNRKRLRSKTKMGYRNMDSIGLGTVPLGSYSAATAYSSYLLYTIFIIIITRTLIDC